MSSALGTIFTVIPYRNCLLLLVAFMIDGGLNLASLSCIKGGNGRCQVITPYRGIKSDPRLYPFPLPIGVLRRLYFLLRLKRETADQSAVSG